MSATRILALLSALAVLCGPWGLLGLVHSHGHGEHHHHHDHEHGSPAGEESHSHPEEDCGLCQALKAGATALEIDALDAVHVERAVSAERPAPFVARSVPDSHRERGPPTLS